LQPSPRPLVLHLHHELRTLTTTLCMKIQTTILQQQLNPINDYIPWLIVKFVSFQEYFNSLDTPESQNHPNIFR
jgi:hypothetical protein